MLVIPASSQVLREAMAAGYIETFLAAGAMLGTPGCGPCMGNHMGIPAPGEVTISSANRNFRGRMGTAESDVYLASPAVVAASAVAGRIVDPREIVEGGERRVVSEERRVDGCTEGTDAELKACKTIAGSSERVASSRLVTDNPTATFTLHGHHSTSALLHSPLSTLTSLPAASGNTATTSTPT